VGIFVEVFSEEAAHDFFGVFVVHADLFCLRKEELTIWSLPAVAKVL